MGRLKGEGGGRRKVNLEESWESATLTLDGKMIVVLFGIVQLISLEDFITLGIRELW